MILMRVLMCALVWMECAQCADILAMFPIPFKSHQAVFKPLIIELAKRGHRVTYVSPLEIDTSPATLTQIRVNNTMDKLHVIMDKGGEGWMSQGLKWIMDKWVNLMVLHIGEVLTQLFLEEPSVQAILQDTTTKYDLLLLETTFAQESLAALSHKYNAPIVEIMSTSNFLWTYFVHGNPYDPNYIMEQGSDFPDHMTFCERLINTVLSISNIYSNLYWHMPNAEALANTYIRYPGWETRPPLIDIIRNSSLLLINTHLAVNYPFPLSPNVKEIGGINLQTKLKPLPKEIQNFMDGAKHGVIYFTLGSHISVSTTLGDKLKDEFLKAFGKLKQRILWKWETDFPNLPSNVKVSQWFPQQDILAHKNIVLFISHGGLLSITESVYNGVPILGIPILGDQHKNVAQIKAAGYGIPMDLTNITEASISKAINEMISNPRYKEKAIERSKIFRDKPETALETAVYWTEYVLRHKGAHHLKPAVATMPWCQQAMLDVYSVLAVIVLIPMYISYKLIKFICRCLCRKSKNKQIDKKKKE